MKSRHRSLNDWSACASMHLSLAMPMSRTNRGARIRMHIKKLPDWSARLARPADGTLKLPCDELFLGQNSSRRSDIRGGPSRHYHMLTVPSPEDMAAQSCGVHNGRAAPMCWFVHSIDCAT
jgi:hypothetical protein